MPNSSRCCCNCIMMVFVFCVFIVIVLTVVCGYCLPAPALTPDEIVGMAGGPLVVIDCFGMLSDEKIRRYFELGCEVKGLGRGHIQRIKPERTRGLKE